MDIKKTLRRVGFILAVTATVAIGQTNLVGRWDLMKGPGRNNPNKMELLRDGTGIVDGIGVTYKTEGGRFYLIAIGKASSYSYTLSGPKLTLTNDDDEILKYLKKGHTLSERDVKLFLEGEDKTLSKSTVPNSVGSVKIGDLTWTKQNINIETPGSSCYEDKESNCAKYGRLYTWEAAKSACASMGGGYRLPDTADWNKLVTFAGGGKIAKKLKSKSGWNENGNGTDDYGFSALPGGYPSYYNGSFGHVGINGTWWSATEYDGVYAYGRNMRYNGDAVFVTTAVKGGALSVRCVAPN